MKKAIIGVAAALVACATQASPYAVVSVGSAKIELDCTGADSCDESGTGLKLLGGYKFSPNVAIEAGYLDFGKASASDSGIGADFKVNGFAVGGAFHQELNQSVNFVARLGLASLKTKVNGSVAGFGSGSASETNTQLYGGLGLGYKISPTISLDGSFDFSKAELDGEKADVKMFSVGLTFAF